MVGIFRLLMGLAHLGMLVNFVSDSVVIGFTAGAGILIIASQLRTLMSLEFTSSPGLVDTLYNTALHLSQTHIPSLVLGLGVILLILGRLNPKLPGLLVGLFLASILVGLTSLDDYGIQVIGQIPRSLPSISRLPLLDIDLIAQLSGGALAIGAIGLVEAMSIARAIASQTGQRLDSNQEFIGQGLSNIACGFFSGFTCSGSFSRSSINFKAGARTPMASVFSGILVLIAMFLLAPLAAFVPRTALAGVLIVIAIGMIDRKEITRIWRGARGDVLILLITFLATLFLPLQFAVLVGILASFAVYILRTSSPRLVCVLPDDEFRHLAYQPQKPLCPQLAIFDILGDLYFGAVNHVDKALHEHLSRHPTQRFLLLRLHSVNQCDISGIHALENVMHTFRDQAAGYCRGGDLYMMRIQSSVLQIMQTTGFCKNLGLDHILDEDQGISYLFNKVLDPAICIYECEARAFLECQNLPKNIEGVQFNVPLPSGQVTEISARDLWKQLHVQDPPLVIDVREPREYRRGHIPQAQLISLPNLLAEPPDLPLDHRVVFVCQGGRRSSRAAFLFINKGFSKTMVLQGGMLAWEAANLLEAVD